MRWGKAVSYTNLDVYKRQALGDLVIGFVEPLQILQRPHASVAHLSSGYSLFSIYQLP